ncbi:MAG TPA: adenine phosphoribosyltransferase [Steroidobacteraceae bacterium]
MPDLKRHVVSIPDFPRPGILFRDISPLLRQHFDATLDALEKAIPAEEWSVLDALAGIESRGFILAAALAARHRKGFVPIRKKGKLPPPVVDVAYELEYGTGVLEMQCGRGKLLLVDDVLATGGTMRAAAELSRAAGYEVHGLLVLIDLKLIPDFRWQQHSLRSVIQYG